MRRSKRNKKDEIQNFDPTSDETFAYIAGYTSNGVPYGITWEEMRESERKKSMAAPVKLADIVEALQIQMDGWTLFFNKQTGEVVHIHEDAFRALEDQVSGLLENYDKLDNKENIEEAKKIEQNPEDYITLPNRFEVDEWKMMENFAFSRKDEKVSTELQEAARGKGAFRHFKDTIHRLGISEDWYRFRDQAYEQVIQEWCEDNDLQMQ